jgi:hypothetical protein
MSPSFIARLLAFAAALLSAAIPQQAIALTLSTHVSTIYQVGTTDGVSLGHIVSANTDFSRLTAGGSFIASCANSSMQPTTGQRTLSSESLYGGNRLYVTVPTVVPTIVKMPGFVSLPRGTTVNCTYNWTSRAVESGLSYGVGGVAVPVGSNERADGGTQIFYMSVPSLGSEGGYTVCIP